MADELFGRTGMLLGESGMRRLFCAKVAVFGIGGVGGYAAEALARSGVGALDLFDRDRISVSNINRQIIALHSTVGRYKSEVMKERILDINPQARVNAYPCFYTPENAGDFDFTQYDYIVDAIDTVTSKLELAVRAQAAGVPIISSMGAGNKLDPGRLTVTDIFSTSVCPLARVMRRELRARGITRLKVVYSTEPALTPGAEEGGLQPGRRSTPGSVAFVPSVAGLMLAGEVVKDLAAGSEPS